MKFSITILNLLTVNKKYYANGVLPGMAIPFT